MKVKVSVTCELDEEFRDINEIMSLDASTPKTKAMQVKKMHDCIEKLIQKSFDEGVSYERKKKPI
jgi:hypothetical protein